MSINRVDVQQAKRKDALCQNRMREHAQVTGSIPCGSRQARASDLGAEVREGTTRGYRQRLRWMRVYQEEHVNLLKPRGVRTA